MDPRSFTVIIQGEHSGQYASACHGFAAFPTIAPIRVRVVGDDATLSEREDLVDALLSDLAASAAGSPESCTGPGALRCWTTREPVARNLLVVVASDASPSVELNDLVDEWVAQGFDAVAVFRSGLNPDQVLPAALDRQHAPSWVHDVREVAGDLLDTVLLGDEARRIFISYSHRDGAAEAERLAMLLNERRFDVFLDRFRLEPGVDFAERIADELADKAMVVVVETPEAVLSDWVRHELSIAAGQHLGLAAIHVTGRATLPLIDDRARQDWTTDDGSRSLPGRAAPCAAPAEAGGPLELSLASPSGRSSARGGHQRSCPRFQRAIQGAYL